MSNPLDEQAGGLVQITLPNGEIVTARKTLVLELECLRCGKKWVPRFDYIPMKCPSCMRYYWWKAPIRKSKRSSSPEST